MRPARQLCCRGFALTPRAALEGRGALGSTHTRRSLEYYNSTPGGRTHMPTRPLLCVATALQSTGAKIKVQSDPMPMSNERQARARLSALLYWETGVLIGILEYARLAMGFANVWASRYEIR